MLDEANIKKLKKRLVFVLLGLGFGLLLFFFVNYSRVTLVIENNSADYYHYTITSSDGAIVAENETATSDTIRRFLRRDSYNISVINGEASYFGFVNSKGLMRGHSEDITLSAEKPREFIGDNPLPCSSYAENLLLSWNCLGMLSDLQVHTQASETGPSTTQRSVTNMMSADNVVSLFNHKDEHVALVQLQPLGEEPDQRFEYGLFEVSPSSRGEATKYEDGVLLPYLSRNHTYGAMSTGERIIIYRYDGNEIFELDAINDENPKQIDPLDQDNVDMPLYSVNYSFNTLTLAYGNVALDNLSDRMLHDESFLDVERQDDREAQEASDRKTNIFLLNDEATRHIEMDYSPRQAAVCGENLLCALRGDQLLVYEINEDNTLGEIRRINRVIQFDTIGENTVVVQHNGVSVINMQQSSGAYDYTFQDYEFCGLNVLNESEYTVCIRNEGNFPRSKSILHIDRENEQELSVIDKKVYQLTRHDEVELVAPYKNHIHVLPNYGEKIYIENEGEFGHDPDVVNEVSSSIDELINELNFPDNYNIVLPRR